MGLAMSRKGRWGPKTASNALGAIGHGGGLVHYPLDEIVRPERPMRLKRTPWGDRAQRGCFPVCQECGRRDRCECQKPDGARAPETPRLKAGGPGRSFGMSSGATTIALAAIKRPGNHNCGGEGW